MHARSMRGMAIFPLLLSVGLWARYGAAQNNSNGQTQAGAAGQAQGLSPQQQQAQQIGYNAGFRAGVTDHQQGHAYDFSTHASYQNATQGYYQGSGLTQQAYKLNYQTGFENGYDDGYHGRSSSPGSTRQRTYSSIAPQGAAANPAAPANEASTAPAPGGSHHAGTIPQGTILSLQLNNTLSSSSSSEGEPFSAKVVKAVYDANGNVLVPVGSLVEGTIGQVKKGGALGGTSSIALNFQQLQLPDGHVAALHANLSNVNAQGKGVTGELGSITQGTAQANKEGQVQQSNTRRTVGNVAAGTVVGTLLGAITGHAVAGAAIGAAAGLGTVLMTSGHALDLHAGTPMSITLTQPVYVQ